MIFIHPLRRKIRNTKRGERFETLELACSFSRIIIPTPFTTTSLITSHPHTTFPRLSLTADASVVVSRGKKRYIFDLSCDLKFEVVDSDDDTVLGKGSMSLPDISSTAASDGDWELQLSWKKGGGNEGVTRLGKQFQESIKGSLTKFVQQFNSEF